MPTAVARAKGALSLAVQIYTRFGKYFSMLVRMLVEQQQQQLLPQ
jgi:hypothetical protein